jgi:hypothetical protein
MGIHLVRIERSEAIDEPQIDLEKLNGNAYADDTGKIKDLVLVNGLWVIEYLEDDDGPLLEED